MEDTRIISSTEGDATKCILTSSGTCLKFDPRQSYCETWSGSIDTCKDRCGEVPVIVDESSGSLQGRVKRYFLVKQ